MLAKLFLIIASVLLVLAAYTQFGVYRLDKKYPKIGSLMEVEGQQIHYVDSGRDQNDKKVLVLLHGASSNLRDFTSSVAQPLAKHYRVISIDRPGFGHSTRKSENWMNPADQARVVHKLLQKLGVKQPVLVGHSWSGALSLSYALDYAEDLSALILLTPAAYPWFTPAAVYNRIAGIPVLGKMMAYTLAYPLGQMVIDTGIKGALAPTPVPQGYREHTAIETMLRPRTFMANAEDLSKLNDFLQIQSKRYGEINAPILAIIATGDTVVSNDIHTRQLESALDQVEVVTIQGAGHAPHHTHGKQVLQWITNFVNTLK